MSNKVVAVAAPSVRTRITELFKIKYPVLLPGMSWISTPELVAAVSNTGGLGILATGPLSAQETRDSIHKIRNLTDKPFGIGATLLMPGASENAKIALDEQVPVINVSLGKANWIADTAHEYGGVVLSTVTNAKHGAAAIDAGADALMVTGYEAAAHGGDIGSLVLISSMSTKFPNTPIVGAGGFANGRTLAAALSLGADGVAMGSRFATTKESPLAETIKDAITIHTESDTVYGSNFDGIPARVLKTNTSTKVMNKRPFIGTIIYRAFMAAKELKIPLYKVLPGLITQYEKMFIIAQFGAATKQIQAATVDGSLDDGVQFIGQSMGMINDVPTVDEMMQRIIQESKEASQYTAQLFS